MKPADPNVHGGIPKSLYDAQAQGLECLVEPWTELKLLSWTMAVDDRVDLYVNDDPTPVTGKTVAPGEEQQRIRLYVPHGRLRNGVNRLHYKVVRPSGNREDSRDLNVLYHLRSPGEPAPQGLDLVIPPDVIKDGVSAARATQGVEFGFTYSNRRAFDRVRFLIGNETIEWEITDASVPVTKTLFTDNFLKVGVNPNTQCDYVVIDQLGNPNSSPTKQIDVHLADDTIKLNPPTLVAPAVNPIVPLQYPNGVTLRIEFLTALTGDKAQLVEINAPAGATPFPAVAFNANKRTNTVLTQAFLAARHGQPLEFRWALIRGGKEIDRSGPLLLTVNRIADGDARFPTPVIVGYSGAELDVTKLVATDKVNIAPWTPLGQFVWLRYEGVNSNGAPIFFDDLNGVPHSDAQGLTRPALVDWLKALQHGSVVTISFSVGYSAVADRNTAVTFPVRQYTVSSAVTINPPTTPANPVDPLSFPAGVLVSVFAASSQPGDQAQLLHLNALPGAPAFPVLPLNQNAATFTLDAKFLGEWHGKEAAQLVWVLIRGGKEIARSSALLLTVKRIADGDSRLPTPTIDRASGDVLDVTKLLATDQLRVATWLLQFAGQYLWLRYDGFNSSGAAIFFEDLKGELHNGTQGLVRPALLAWLKTLKHGSRLTISFRVNFARKAELSGAVTFPLRVHSIKAVPDVPELIVDDSPMSLTGTNVAVPGYMTSTGMVGTVKFTGNDPVGTAEQRRASGGVPPYTYESSNFRVASVDINGVVRSEGNGSATITVRDAANQTRSFSVDTDNVTQVLFSTRGTYAQLAAYISQRRGSRIPNSLTDPRLLIWARRYIAVSPGVSLAFTLGLPNSANVRTQLSIVRIPSGQLINSQGSLAAPDYTTLQCHYFYVNPNSAGSFGVQNTEEAEVEWSDEGIFVNTPEM